MNEYQEISDTDVESIYDHFENGLDTNIEVQETFTKTMGRVFLSPEDGFHYYD